MLTGTAKYTFLLAALFLALLGRITSADRTQTLLLEAEDAVADENGPYFSTAIAGYSGTGCMVYGSLTQNNTGLNFSVYTRDAGSYFLTIRYCSPYGNKINDLYVNSVKIAGIDFTLTDYTWHDRVFGNITLNEGDNVVRIQENWGYFYVDYITLDGFPVTATDPVPAIHETVGGNLSQVCWSNPDPNDPEHVITCDVYLGDTPPNRSVPNYGLTQIETGTEETCATIPFALDPFTTYYWIVDCWDDGGEGPYLLRGYTWDFNTDNEAPVADAGPDQYVALGNEGDPGTATVTLDGLASIDDGLPSNTLNYLWQQVSGPAGVVIFPYDAAVTEIYPPAVGTYEFHLTVDDTDLQDTDTVLIHVFETRCQALKAQVGFVLDTGDINEDCLVDLEDMADMVKNWLECNSLAPCIE